MSTNHDHIIRPDTRFYSQNRVKHDPHELAVKYGGQWIAWSPDGTRVLAHGEDQDAVIEQLRAAGVHYSEVVWESMPPLGAEDSLL